MKLVEGSKYSSYILKWLVLQNPAWACTHNGQVYVPKQYTVQITHNLNNARVSHVCHMCVLCMSCHTHGILSLWLHTHAKLMTKTHSTRTHTVCTRGNMHTVFAHALTRTCTRMQFLPTSHSLHAYGLLALFQLTNFTVNEPVATFPSLIAICYLLILAAILVIIIAYSKIKREVTKPKRPCTCHY